MDKYKPILSKLYLEEDGGKSEFRFLAYKWSYTPDFTRDLLYKFYKCKIYITV